MYETIGLTTFCDEFVNKKDSNHDLYSGRVRIFDFKLTKVLRGVKYKNMLKKNFIVLETDYVSFKGSLTPEQIEKLRQPKQELTLQYVVDPYGDIRQRLKDAHLGHFLQLHKIDFVRLVNLCASLFCPAFSHDVGSVKLVRTKAQASDYFYMDIEYNHEYGEAGANTLMMIIETAIALSFLCVDRFESNLDKLIVFLMQEYEYDRQLNLLSLYGSKLFYNNHCSRLLAIKKLDRTKKTAKKDDPRLQIISLGTKIQLTKERL